MNTSNVCLIQLEIDALDELKMAFSSLTISSYDSIKQKLKNELLKRKVVAMPPKKESVPQT